MAKTDMSPTQKIDLFKQIVLFWCQGLSANEFKVIMWIFANTVGRGNITGRYSLNQLMKGVPKRSGDDWWCGGVGMSLSTLRRTLTSLQELGALIILENTRWGTEYAINIEWTPQVEFTKRPKRT